MATKLTCMTKGRCHFFIGNRKDGGQLGERFVAGVTEAAMPVEGRGCGASKEGGGGEVQRVQRPGAIAPDDHVPGLKVLHRKAKWVKFNGTIVISSKTTYRD